MKFKYPSSLDGYFKLVANQIFQLQIEDEQRQREEIREHVNLVEQRCNHLQAEKDELQILMDGV